ncbi:MAG: histidine triad nucleotide-binding protein [Chloroflexota bacterium]|nr:histidine triad nucleotide-binding protein [Chloroflexota bacterium]
MGKDCIFCRIVAGEVPSDTLYQDDHLVAIRDTNPQAPTHILILPRAHVPSLADLTAEQEPLMGSMIRVASELAKAEGVADKGYRLVINSGLEAGQEVPHLHMHLLGGRPMGGLG